MTTRLADVMRGGVVESTHDGAIAVVDVDGKLVAWAGDPDRFAFFRSSAKPFQAIPVVESGAADAFGLTEAELALCCASHHAERHHQEEVLAMLRKLGLDEGALQCGSPLPSDESEIALIMTGQRQRSPLQCDCSGKHSGMLASCLQLGLPIETYLEPTHPLQQQIKGLVAEACRVPADSFTMGTDGCSLPTFGSTVRAFATSYAALASPEAVPAGAGREHATALNRLRSAMIAYPENVSGSGALVASVMNHGKGKLVCKSGAEGLICIGAPERGLGIAIRVADGSFRSHPVIVAEVLRELDLVDDATVDAIMAEHDPIIRNHNGIVVGEHRAAFELAQA